MKFKDKIEDFKRNNKKLELVRLAKRRACSILYNLHTIDPTDKEISIVKKAIQNIYPLTTGQIKLAYEHFHKDGYYDGNAKDLHIERITPKVARIHISEFTEEELELARHLWLDINQPTRSIEISRGEDKIHVPSHILYTFILADRPGIKMTSVRIRNAITLWLSNMSLKEIYLITGVGTIRLYYEIKMYNRHNTIAGKTLVSDDPISKEFNNFDLISTRNAAYNYSIIKSPKNTISKQRMNLNYILLCDQLVKNSSNRIKNIFNKRVIAQKNNKYKKYRNGHSNDPLFLAGELKNNTIRKKSGCK